MHQFEKSGYQNRQRGFTLIELMIVVAIVTILAAVGYPSYTDYIMRSHRQAARILPDRGSPGAVFPR
jgi:prepilin-type N-terminal cleavage/methylation domain-containing protein